jgi:hypothetical protein
MSLPWVTHQLHITDCLLIRATFALCIQYMRGLS